MAGAEDPAAKRNVGLASSKGLGYAQMTGLRLAGRDLVDLLSTGEEGTGVQGLTPAERVRLGVLGEHEVSARR